MQETKGKAQLSENEDHGIWSHHFMGNRWGNTVSTVSPSISHHFMGNRWGNSGNSVRLYFLGLKITADGDCSHEIKRHFLLGRKVMTNLDSIFKSRDITLPTEVHLVKAMVFPVVMYGCESWTVKKAERRRIDAFELWCWRRLLRVPWTARRTNQSILKALQSCPTLCDPRDGSPPGSPVPGILQARTLEWVAISFSNAGK